MKLHINHYQFLWLGCLFILAPNLLAQSNNPYQFVSPKPSSVMVSNKTNIILKHSCAIDESSLSSSLIWVEGSKSGINTGELILSDDNRTLVFNPHQAFDENEIVNVTLIKGIKAQTGAEIPEFSFHFITAPSDIIQLQNSSFDESYSGTGVPILKALKNSAIDNSLPEPPITINSINNPSPGYIFMATWDRNVPAKYGNFIFVLDKNGAIVDSVRVNGAPINFEIQQNGLLTYALGKYKYNVPNPGEELQHMVLNDKLEVIDSFKMKNGYIADFHEFKMMPNGHVMMMTYHTIKYDMSTVVDSGKTDVSLVINVIHEQDRNRNVVFEWRNIDYIPITDSDLDLTASRINYSTLNGFDIDTDGNILVSFREHSQIAKISKETGELIWRMGGRLSEFTYVGEHEENAPYYHARQHHVQRLANGNITLFDNGEFHTPPYSRAVEYGIDEENKVATLVSEWRYPNGNILCMTAGNAEKLPNGGWFIGYGVQNPQFVKRSAVEVHPDGSIALEISLPAGILAYRVTKLPWKENVIKPGFTHFDVNSGETYSFNNDSISTGITITYNELGSVDNNEATITRIPYGPVKPEYIENIITVYPVSIIYEGVAISSQNSEFRVDLSVYTEIKEPGKTMAYIREFPSQGLFASKPTIYDSINNELLVSLSEFGEIVFGVPDTNISNHSPILYEPLNKQEIISQDTIVISWTGKGMYHSFNLQVSTDSTFATVQEEINTNLSYYSISGLTDSTEIFWRVNSVLGDQTSTWSDVWSFTYTESTINNIETQFMANNGHRLEQNYPNPFIQKTTISYTLEKSGFVTLKIYNSIGEEVYTLVNEYQNFGKQTAVFNSGKYPDGIYYCILQVGEKFEDIKKMILIR